jgi:hypothetical protein
VECRVGSDDAEAIVRIPCPLYRVGGDAHLTQCFVPPPSPLAARRWAESSDCDNA